MCFEIAAVFVERGVEGYLGWVICTWKSDWRPGVVSIVPFADCFISHVGYRFAPFFVSSTLVSHWRCS